MMQHGHCRGPGQARPIVCPPKFCCRDTFTPRELPVIHPIVNVNRHNIVDVPRHYFPETTKNVMGTTISPFSGYGPQFGGGRSFEGTFQGTLDGGFGPGGPGFY